MNQIRAIGRAIIRSLGKIIAVPLLILLAPFLIVGFCLLAVFRLVSWPIVKRLKQKPFDSAAWKAATLTFEPRDTPRTDVRWWMANDLIRQLPKKSWEEVITLLGEPDWPLLRPDISEYLKRRVLSYYLSSSFPIGRWVLSIHFDEDGTAKSAKSEYSD